MSQRIVSIWFKHLVTDRKIRQEAHLKDVPFAMVMQERNRRIIKAVNAIAQARGIFVNMVAADGRAILPELQVFDFHPEHQQKLLMALAEWCIRFTPHVTLDPPDGLLLDASGCTHLWGGEEEYLHTIFKHFNGLGYTIQIAMAGTSATAWAISHYGQKKMEVIAPGNETETLSGLPSEALRVDIATLDRLHKLGLTTLGSFIHLPRTALRRRFGQSILKLMDKALGTEIEFLESIRPPAPYRENLQSLEPISTAVGIEIALKTLLQTLCERLNKESKGLRKCELLCYRLDGNIQKIEIGTSSPSRNAEHLFKLFEIHIQLIDPDLGIELFLLEATIVEELLASQDALWAVTNSNEKAIAELQDRLTGKIGAQNIQSYVAEEYHWPEYSVKTLNSLVNSDPTVPWRNDLPRPSHLLLVPELIEVSVPMPDYPPLLFIHKGVRHSILKADGPERIEQEWWKQQGLYRDYYCVEDSQGERYWLFRSGDYSSNVNVKWFLHGYFS